MASRQPRKTPAAAVRAGTTAREVVSRRLGEQARRFPDLSLVPLATDGLADRDAALAHGIYDAAIRRWHTLGYLLDRVLTQPLRLLEPALQGVLLGGAAQLLLMDRIPAHAAIDESVELAKRLVRPGAGGLANAVLRKVALMRAESPDGEPPVMSPRDRLPLSDGRWLRLSGPLLPEREPERTAVSTSHPDWLMRRWGVRFSSAGVLDLALHSLASPPVILNTAHAAGPLPASLVPHSLPGHHIFAGDRAELLSLLGSRADIWVQDPASTRAVAGAAHLTPSLVIDACAGQGTKTRQLAATFPEARIVATDADPQRLRTLAKVFGEGSGGRVEVVRPADLLPRFAGKADLVLLDVPCSNTGVLARRVEAKYRCDEQQLTRLVEIQRQIIDSTVPLLSAPGGQRRGRILYSTCSIDDEENGQQVAWAVRTFQLRVERSHAELPAGRPGGDPATYHDGSYSALLA